MGAAGSPPLGITFVVTIISGASHYFWRSSLSPIPVASAADCRARRSGIGSPGYKIAWLQDRPADVKPLVDVGCGHFLVAHQHLVTRQRLLLRNVFFGESRRPIACADAFLRRSEVGHRPLSDRPAFELRQVAEDRLDGLKHKYQIRIEGSNLRHPGAWPSLPFRL